MMASENRTLSPKVDPACGVIKHSMPRCKSLPDGRQQLTANCPIGISLLYDTTGEMAAGLSVIEDQIADIYTWAAEMLPAHDIQLQMGIFGDVRSDRFPLQLTEYESSCNELLESVKEFVPEGQGGDEAEDPQYGLFAAAYLTRRYMNQLGLELKDYHFLITDATAHDYASVSALKKLFGDRVF